MYSKDLIKLLLETQLAFTPQNIKPNKSHGYYYPHRILTEEIFFEDQIDYLNSQKGQVRDRVVVFLIDSGSENFQAVILFLSQIDRNAATNCLAWFNSKDQIKAPLTKEQQVFLSQLYRQVGCFILGNGYGEAMHSQIRAYCEKTYQATCIVHEQPIASGQYASVVFTECLLRIVKRQALSQIDLTQVSKEHRASLVDLLSRWWLDIRVRQPDTYTELTDLAQRLLKYALIQRKRAPQTGQQYQESTFNELNELLLQDKNQKKLIYNAQITDLAMAFKDLNLQTVAGLLGFYQPENLPGLVRCLEKECERQQKLIKKWEADFATLSSQRRWLRRSNNLIEYLWEESFYPYSFARILSEVVPLTGYVGLKLSYSPGLKPEQLQQLPLFKILRGFGALLGIGIDFYLGEYSLTRRAVIGNSSDYLANLIEDSLIDDSKAKVRKPWSITLSVDKAALYRSVCLTVPGSDLMMKTLFVHNMSNSVAELFQTQYTGTPKNATKNTFTVHFSLNRQTLYHSLYLTVSLAEWLILSEPQYFTQATTGLFCGMLFSYIATHLFLGQASTSQALLPELAVIKFFASSLGYLIGQFITSSVTFLSDFAIDKLATRNALSQAFSDKVTRMENEVGYKGGLTDFSETPMYSPRFWLSRRDNVRLTWTDSVGLKESQCEVVPNQDGTHALLCNEPVASQLMGLGR